MVQQEEQVAADVKLVRNLLEQEFLQAETTCHEEDVDEGGGTLAQVWIPGWSLNEKMLKLLSMFKESSGGGVLAQVWIPMKHGNQLFLSTCEESYLLDHIFAGYHDLLRMFTFSAEEMGSSLGLSA